MIKKVLNVNNNEIEFDFMDYGTNDYVLIITSFEVLGYNHYHYKNLIEGFKENEISYAVLSHIGANNTKMAKEFNVNLMLDSYRELMNEITFSGKPYVYTYSYGSIIADLLISQQIIDPNGIIAINPIFNYESLLPLLNKSELNVAAHPKEELYVSRLLEDYTPGLGFVSKNTKGVIFKGKLDLIESFESYLKSKQELAGISDKIVWQELKDYGHVIPTNALNTIQTFSVKVFAKLIKEES